MNLNLELANAKQIAVDLATKVTQFGIPIPIPIPIPLEGGAK
jgi:hypothetical protein